MQGQSTAILDRSGQPMLPASNSEAVGHQTSPPLGADAGSLMRRGGDTSYKAASTRSRHIGGWGARLESINAGILRDGPQTRARARDIVKNDPLGAQAARIIVQSVCGNRLRLALMPNYTLLNIS